MRTYREVIQEIIPTHAIAEAERRRYWQQPEVGDPFRCDDGFCALGILLRETRRDFWRGRHEPFPQPLDFPGAIEDASPTVRRRRLALDTIMRANDRGLLAWPGSLTNLLDRPLKVTVH